MLNRTYEMMARVEETQMNPNEDPVVEYGGRQSDILSTRLRQIRLRLLAKSLRGSQLSSQARSSRGMSYLPNQKAFSLHQGAKRE
jgi:hypothetical protein